MEFYTDEEKLKKSLCWKCRYRIRRVIIPNDYSEFGIDIDDIDGVTEDSTIMLISNECMLLDTDLLNHTVVDCNQFDSLESQSIFKNKFI